MSNGYRQLLTLLVAGVALLMVHDLLTGPEFTVGDDRRVLRHAPVTPCNRDILAMPEPVAPAAGSAQNKKDASLEPVHDSFRFDATRMVTLGNTATIEKDAVQPLLLRSLTSAPPDLKLRASWTTGITGTEALRLINNDDTCSVRHSPDQTLAYEGTIELLVKIDAFRPYGGLVHKGEAPDWSDESYALIFQESPDKGLLFSMVNDAGEIQYLRSTVPVAEGAWYHLAVTWNLEKVAMYINGKKVSEKVNTIGTMKSSSGSLQIGSQLPEPASSDLGTLAINGTIDEFALYRRSLEGDELSLRHAGFLGSGGGTVDAGMTSRLVIIILGGAGLVAFYFRSRRRQEKSLRKESWKYFPATGGNS